MKVALFLPLCLYLSHVSEGWILTRCDFHERAVEYLSDLASPEDWTCLAFYKSNFETGKLRDLGRTREYGIFQISSGEWCHDGKTANSKNKCGIECSKLLDDDLDDDIKCARLIATLAHGLTPWNSWVYKCKGKDVSQYGEGCN